jgi:hypothetical protein
VLPKLFITATILLLLSAIAFTYLSRQKRVILQHLLVWQFSLDLVLATLFSHSAGGITSKFTLLFFMTVATGSVVLPRLQAFAIASGAVILMYLEHIHATITFNNHINFEYELMFTFGVLLFLVAGLLSFLAEKLRIIELNAYVPGQENIEEYLVREEKNALLAALRASDGNKTKAAKLLGLSFRSYRYKLSKYELE